MSRRQQRGNFPRSAARVSTRITGNMAAAQTVADALAAATAAGSRIDTLEQQLLLISGQLQTLVTAATTGGGGAGGGGSGGAAGSSGSGGAAGSSGSGGGAPVAVHQRRRLDTSGVDKLHGDVTIPLLRSWRNRWNDFVELNQLATYSGSEQMAAFRMETGVPNKLNDTVAPWGLILRQLHV